jgi:hypothetical protein
VVVPVGVVAVAVPVGVVAVASVADTVVTDWTEVSTGMGVVVVVVPVGATVFVGGVSG